MHELKTNIKALKTQAGVTDACGRHGRRRALRNLGEIETLNNQLDGKKGDLRIVATAIKVIKAELS